MNTAGSGMAANDAECVLFTSPWYSRNWLVACMHGATAESSRDAPSAMKAK